MLVQVVEAGGDARDFLLGLVEVLDLVDGGFLRRPLMAVKPPVRRLSALGNLEDHLFRVVQHLVGRPALGLVGAADDLNWRQ
jgi:hypothetical protein